MILRRTTEIINLRMELVLASRSPHCLHPGQCMVSTTPSALGEKRRCKDGNGLLGLYATRGKDMVSFLKQTIS